MAWRRRSEHVDKDQPEIVKRLRKVGCSVEVIGQPVDLLVGCQGVTMIAEVKRKPGPRGGTSKGRLNEKQQRFFETWRGSVLLVNLDDCIEVVSEELRRLGRQGIAPPASPPQGAPVTMDQRACRE